MVLERKFLYKCSILIKMSNIKIKVLLGSASHFLPTHYLNKSLSWLKPAEKFWKKSYAGNLNVWTFKRNSCYFSKPNDDDNSSVVSNDMLTSAFMKGSSGHPCSSQPQMQLNRDLTFLPSNVLLTHKYWWWRYRPLCHN